MKEPRLASFRFLVPSLERSIASPNYRPVDLLNRCFRLFVVHRGRPVMGEYYFTTDRDFLINNLDPLIVWDDDYWRVPCPRDIIFTKGVNPCPPTASPTVEPLDWSDPQILASDSSVLAACDGPGDLWWY